MPWEFLVNVPKIVSLWRADEAAGKVYLPLVAGLRDAATTMHVTRSLDDWTSTMFWRTAYFTLCVWTSIALTCAPRIKPPAAASGGDRRDAKPLVVHAGIPV